MASIFHKLLRTVKFSYFFVLVGFALFLTGFLSPLWNVFGNTRYIYPYPLTTIGVWSFCYYVGIYQSCRYYDAGISSTFVRVTECFALFIYLCSFVAMVIFIRDPKKSTFIVPPSCGMIAVAHTLLSVILWPGLFPLFRVDLSWGYWCTAISTLFATCGVALQAYQMTTVKDGSYKELI